MITWKTHLMMFLVTLIVYAEGILFALFNNKNESKVTEWSVVHGDALEKSATFRGIWPYKKSE